MVRIRVKIVDVFSRDVPSDMPHIGIKYETQSVHKIGEPEDNIDYRLVNGTIYVFPEHFNSPIGSVINCYRISELIIEDIRKCLARIKEASSIKDKLTGKEMIVEV